MNIRAGGVRRWLRTHKKQVAFGVPTGILGLFLVVQLVYPYDRLAPWQQIDGRQLGTATIDSAAAQLNSQYDQRTLSLYFGKTAAPQHQPKFAEFGLEVDNTARVAQAAYPWQLRLVPTSILWSHMVIKPGTPTYGRDSKKLDAYLTTHFGTACHVEPRNATAKVSGDAVVVVPEQDGGNCQRQDVTKTLASVTPTLTAQTSAHIAIDPLPATLAADAVKPIVATLNRQLSQPATLTYDGKTDTLPGKTIREWLRFDTDGGAFDIRFDEGKADKYLTDKYGAALARQAGVSKVATQDFVETARQDGQTGRQLDTAKTYANLKQFLFAKSTTVPLGEALVQPTVQYTRSYSATDTGLSALMKNYAESHPGVYGVSLIELDGKRRRAAYQDDRKFTTASTYKLYVGFSTLKRIESGEFKWSDQVSGGRDLAKCFDDMIVKSDNACAEALVARIGYASLTKDAQTIVSANTTFLDKESYKTTAGDLSTFMASLATGQIPLSNDSKARFVDALKRNVYRQGIPAGASGQVADKVGFLDGLLHDAAIVYSPSGTYVLSVMTDKSSWATIADLTREIEKLRAQ